ncbi:MAG: hypothetical protein GY909_09500 [Oligoflexia bacterium]|nr:hypothetical protein [Oligoflexia bacterium]
MMKALFISLIFLVITSTSANVALVDCENGFNQQFFELSQLAEAMDDVNHRVASDLAKDYVKKLCYKGKGEGENIRFRDGQIVFYIYSDSYDVSDKYFFCKNKKGYRSFLSRIKGTIINVASERIRTEQRERVAQDRRENPERYRQRTTSSESTSTSSRSTRQTSTEKRYRCIIPGYIKTVREISEAQLFGFTNTYGEAACTEVN